MLQKISGMEKIMDERWGGGVSRFSVGIFLSHSAEKFCGEPFNVSENSWYRKILWIRGMEGGDVTIRHCKNVWPDRDSSPRPAASEKCCPNPTAVIYF